MIDRFYSALNPQELLLQALSSELGGLPALFWRVNLVQNEISFLNHHAMPGIGEEIVRLLQDESCAEKMLAEEDRPAFMRYRDALRRRQPVFEMLRIYGQDGVVHWLCIVGSPDSEMSFGYLGVVADCTSMANRILRVGSNTSLTEHIELFDNPVFMIRTRDRNIVAANEAAQNLFGISPSPSGRSSVSDIFSHETNPNMHKVYEQLLFAREWKGVLNLSKASGRQLPCTTHIRTYERDGMNLLWVSLFPEALQKSVGTATASTDDFPDKALAEAMKRGASAKDLLQALLDKGNPEGRFDAMLLSRIYIEDGRIEVTGAGHPFETVTANDTHPYRGSIAENMVLFDLDHVIVKDTTKSIKPIDWALFIPRGIHSYCALPFFADGVLKDVLIFCSTQPAMFDEADLPLYKNLAALFWSELPRVVPQI